VLQKDTSEQLYEAAHSQKGEQLPQREVKQRQFLNGARPLNNYTVFKRAGEAYATSWLWNWDFI
jgi:hypothetical protein